MIAQLQQIGMAQKLIRQSISLKPPLPQIRVNASPKNATSYSPRSPYIVRTNSNAKIPKKISTEKSIIEKQISKQLKYAKPLSFQPKQISLISSQSNIYTGSFNNIKLSDSQETIQKNKTYSRQKGELSSLKKENSIEKAGNIIFDSFSGDNNSTNKRSGIDKNEDYYTYWKNKAHQYLQTNMKLMEQIRKLNHENQNLKEIVDKMRLKQSETQSNSVKQRIKQKSEGELSSEIRKYNLHYMKKIEQMEGQLKRKEMMISTYEIKLKQLNQKVIGDQERLKLMARMKEQVQFLREQNIKIQAKAKIQDGYKINQYSISTEKGKPKDFKNVYK